MRCARLRMALLWASALGLLTCGGAAPSEPSAATTVTITGIRYVRTAIDDGTALGENPSLHVWYFSRGGGSVECALTRVSDNEFRCAELKDVPVNLATCSPAPTAQANPHVAAISDPARQNLVASDLFVGDRLRPRADPPHEFVDFTVDPCGRVRPYPQ